MGYHRTCCPTIPSLHGNETHVNKYLRAGAGTNGKLMDCLEETYIVCFRAGTHETQRIDKTVLTMNRNIMWKYKSKENVNAATCMPSFDVGHK